MATRLGSNEQVRHSKKKDQNLFEGFIPSLISQTTLASIAAKRPPIIRDRPSCINSRACLVPETNAFGSPYGSASISVVRDYPYRRYGMGGHGDQCPGLQCSLGGKLLAGSPRFNYQ